jgi:hypothetical protein
MWWQMHSRRRRSKQPAIVPSPKNPPPHSTPTIAEPPLPPANQQRAAQPPPALDFAAIAAAQASCPDVVAMRGSPSLQTVQRPVGSVQLLGDISAGVFRPFLPAQFRQAAIRSLHDVHHPGVRATCRLVSAAFCWPHMKKHTAVAARGRLGCQSGKTHHHVHLQPEHIPFLTADWLTCMSTWWDRCLSQQA